MANTNQVIKTTLQRLKRSGINVPVREKAILVKRLEAPDPLRKPVVFFNASTRLVGMSLNAAYAMLTSWALRLEGMQVMHFVCKGGMSHCVLGTSRDDIRQPPPCPACIAQSEAIYQGAEVTSFKYQPDPRLQNTLDGLSLPQLEQLELELDGRGGNQPIPLGKLVVPSVRWVLRRHHLQDDASTRYLFREYIFSGAMIAREFSAMLDKVDPQAVVVFNGQFFPEATARWIALGRGVRCITHEVGLRPFSAFFTTGEATAYPLSVPDDFELDQAQNTRLDAYLEQRFQGKFSMAGIQFWPNMQLMDEALQRRLEQYKHIVPVFTNVIFDTSQPHSNVIFTDMFAWLDLILDVAKAYPETLLIIRAHPDEDRSGKESRESVRQWAELRQVSELPNVTFIGATQRLSSYELIQRAKFVMIYNSTIGLEASLMGAVVLCAGRSRFTQLPTVFFPASRQAYRRKLNAFLEVDAISAPEKFRRNARRFLYYQLYRSSLPFDHFLQEDGIWPGFVRLRPFKMEELSSTASPSIQTIQKGILENGDFLLEQDA